MRQAFASTMIAMILGMVLATQIVCGCAFPSVQDQLATGDRRPGQTLPIPLKLPREDRLNRVPGQPGQPGANQQGGAQERRPRLGLLDVPLIPSLQPTTAGYATLVYDPRTGDVTINSDNPDGNKFSAVVLESESKRFRPENAAWNPPQQFDVRRPDKMARISPDGFPERNVREGFHWGRVLPENLSIIALLKDLKVTGTHTTGGGSISRYCPVGEEAILLHVISDDSKDTEVSKTADRAPQGESEANAGPSCEQPSVASEDDDEQEGECADIAGGRKLQEAPNASNEDILEEVRKLREEIRLLRTVIEQLVGYLQALDNEP